ncbi:MAG: hypothetical protein QM482_05315 [Sulfurospirillum sp.]
MDELFNATIKFHTAFVGILLILAIVNYFVINDKLDYKALVKRVRTILPLYYLFLATVLFTGLVLLGVAKFTIHYSVIFMVLVWFGILMMTIRRYKKFKSLRSDDERRRDRFVKFSKRKHLIDIALIVITMAIAYATK